MAISSWREYVAVANPREVGLITIAHGVNEFYSVALPPILPLLVADLSISYAQAGALLTVYYVMYSVFQLPAGMLSDRIGKKWLLAAGMFGLAGGLFLAGFAQTYLTLVVAQAIAGIGGSTYHPTGMSLISDLETGGTEGKAMGIHGFGGVAGTAAAPALIGGIAATLDWRRALAVSALVGLVYGVVFAFLFAETPDGSGNDTPGEATSTENPDWLADPRAAIADLIQVPFTGWLVALFGANFFISLEIGATRTFTTSYIFTRAGGESTVLANGVFFVMLVGAAVSSVWAGNLADRFDRRLLGIAAFLASTVLLGTTHLIPATGVLIFAWFFVLGATIYAALPAINALTSSYADRNSSGSLFGIMLTAGSLGGAGGPLLFGVLANRLGLSLAFPAIGAIGLIGAGAMGFLYRA
ncbi:MAG: MFS transporter [Halobacteriales archaeon]|nr:MFS transporter [Halobacteriales archaeon]